VSNWLQIRMKYLVGINERSLTEDEPAALEFRYIDISTVGRGFLASDPICTSFADAPSRARRLVQIGDTIVSTVRTYLRAVWPVSGDADDLVVSTGFAVLTPKHVDPRFLGWWAQGSPFIEAVVSRSVGVSYPAINASEVGDLYMSVPPLDEQRAIADYLDAETARIDALIAKKRRMMGALDEAAAAHSEEQISAVAYGEVPLRRLLLTPPQYGASESGEEGDPSWPRYIRITDLNPNGSLRDDDVRRLPPDLASPYLLADGDLLIARSGATVGKAFIYRRHLGPCCFAGYLIRFRFDPRLMLPELAAAWTQTSHYWSQIRTSSLQATIENVSAERYKDLLVPQVPPRIQMEVLEAIQQRNTVTALTRVALERQIDLLIEHRQALITAAVTGELEIPVPEAVA
jgi:type I restriction enzyme S subunit